MTVVGAAAPDVCTVVVVVSEALVVLVVALIRSEALTVRVPRSASARAPGADAVHVASASVLSALWRTARGRPVHAR